MVNRTWQSMGLVALGAMLLAGMPQTASAGSVDFTWATAVESYTPGLRADGSVIPSSRRNGANALGSDTAPAIGGVNFCSLGMGGQIILSFGTDFTKDSAVVYEVTNGSRANYPETAQLFVSKTLNAADFLFVADVPNLSGEFNLKLSEFIDAAGPFKYLILKDTTDSKFFWDPQTRTGRDRYADGFDVNAVGVTAVTAVPLPAAGWAGLSLLGGLGFAKWRRTRNG